MTALYTYTPYLLAFLSGYFFLHILFHKEESLSLGFHAALAGGLGLGWAGVLGFISLLLFQTYHAAFVFWGMLLSVFLSAAYVEFKLKKSKADIFYVHKASWSSLGILLLFILCSLPLWDHSHFYLYGGWDAWQTWNLKASFIFLGGENWQNLFHPSMWRSSPHYPLLLPLINSFGYILHGDVHLTTHVLTSFFYSFLSVCLLVFSLRYLSASPIPVVLGASLLLMPRFIKLSYSQYADAVLSYYVLAVFVTFLLAKTKHSRRWLILSGLFLGFLSFTKTEGLAFAFLITVFSFPYLLWKNPRGWKFVFTFGSAALVTGIWTLIFKFFYATHNMSFINGLTSAEDPSTWLRLKIILYWLYREFISYHYNGLWFLLTFGLLMRFKICLNKIRWIIPAVLGSYFTIITAYYYINTYFQIEWWLQVSLHRINYALIPLACFWIVSALIWDKNETEDSR